MSDSFIDFGAPRAPVGAALLLTLMSACGTSTSEWEEFRASAEALEDGRLVADHDMVFEDEAELYAYWEEMSFGSPLAEDEGGAARQPLTQSTPGGVPEVWEFPQSMRLTYCVEDDFGSREATLLAALDRAAGFWSQRVGVRFERVDLTDCGTDSDEVVFNVQRHTGVAYNAIAFFPDDPRSQRVVGVADSAFTTSSGGRDLVGILAHELGHVLGFRHEHIWTACTGEGPADATALTSYDPNSVMHYPSCRPPGSASGYRLTELDYEGAIQVYGLAPALIGLVT